MSDLGELGDRWLKAREFGRVCLMTMQDGKYFCRITFQTIPGVDLEAKSPFNCDTPEEAVRLAIDKAAEIIHSITEQAKGLKLLDDKAK